MEHVNPLQTAIGEIVDIKRLNVLFNLHALFGGIVKQKFILFSKIW